MLQKRFLCAVFKSLSVPLKLEEIPLNFLRSDRTKQVKELLLFFRFRCWRFITTVWTTFWTKAPAPLWTSEPRGSQCPSRAWPRSRSRPRPTSSTSWRQARRTERLPLPRWTPRGAARLLEGRNTAAFIRSDMTTSCSSSVLGLTWWWRWRWRAQTKCLDSRLAVRWPCAILPDLNGSPRPKLRGRGWWRRQPSINPWQHWDR